MPELVQEVYDDDDDDVGTTPNTSVHTTPNTSVRTTTTVTTNMCTPGGNKRWFSTFVGGGKRQTYWHPGATAFGPAAHRAALVAPWARLVTRLPRKW